MANIPISALPSVLPSGYTNNDLLVIVNYDYTSGTTKNTPLSGLTSYILSGVTFPTDYLPLSGGTVTGDTIFNQGLTATTISATTYLGLPLDVYVTGGTYSAGTITFTNNSGGTFPVSGITFPTDYLPLSGGTVTGDTIFSSGLTATTISAATYLGLPLDVYVTGGTYSDGTITFTNNSGGTFPVSGITSNVGNQWLIPTGDTVTVNSNYQYFIYGDIIVQGTLILEVDSQLVVINGDVINSGGTITNNGTISNIEIPLFDTKVTGGTYSAGTITFTNNSGGTFTVTGLTTPFTGNTSATCITDLYVTNLNSCSPLHIQPTNSGDVYIGENGGVNVGIGTSTPTEKLFISGNTYITGGSSSFLVGNTQPYLARNLTNDFIQLNYDGFGQSLFASPTGIALSVGSVVGNGLRVNNTNNLVGNLLSYNFADYLFKSYYSGSTNYFEINHIGFNGDNKFGVNTIPTATIHSKGVDSSSSNFGLKVQDSGGTDNFVVRNDGNIYVNTIFTPSYPDTNIKTYVNVGQWVRRLYVDTDIRHHTSNIDNNTIRIGENGGIGFWAENTSPLDGEYNYGGIIYSTNKTLNVRGGINGLNLLGGQSGTLGLNVAIDGKVGVNTSSPSEVFEVSGKTKTTNFQMTSGATSTGYVMVDSDGNGNAQWQPISFITGETLMSTSEINVSAYTATTSFDYYGTTYSSGPITIQLPDPSTTYNGYRITIKDETTNSSLNNITITTPSGNIDNSASPVVMTTNQMSLTLVVRNNNWWII